jgi:hypothetical protein
MIDGITENLILRFSLGTETCNKQGNNPPPTEGGLPALFFHRDTVWRFFLFLQVCVKCQNWLEKLSFEKRA